MRNYTEQVPIPPNEWLYKDEGEESRLFAKKVALPEGAEPWSGCTDAEKVQWEEAHRPPDPEDVEPVNEEAE